jgi:ketosteroid isomerase-like protein
MSDVLTFAEEFFDAVSSGDIEAVSACYRDDVTVWHNYDDVDQTKADNLATLGSIPDRYDSFDYADARMTELADGFLRQHVIVASRDGRTARVPAILRVYVEGRQIHRIEEYFDRGQLMSALS